VHPKSIVKKETQHVLALEPDRDSHLGLLPTGKDCPRGEKMEKGTGRPAGAGCLF